MTVVIINNIHKLMIENRPPCKADKGTGCTCAGLARDHAVDSIADPIGTGNIVGIALAIATGGLLTKKVEHSAKDYSGVTEILSTNLIAGTFAVDLMDFTVTGGNFRMVVVNEDRIIADIEPGTQQILLEGVKGRVALRIAGESAAYSFSMTEFEYNSFAHP